MSAAPDDRSLPEHGHMTIWEHLAELRSRLIKCFIAVGVGAVIGWFLYPYVLHFLRQPWCDLSGTTDCRFLVTDPLEPFGIRLRMSLYLGIALAMPVLLWQIWRFITPALYPHEKRYAIPFVGAALVLFAFGALLAYVTLNPALGFLIEISGGANITTQYTITSYTTLVTYMMLAFGVGFEFPVVLVALMLVGVLTPKRLLSWWRPAIVVIAVVAAVITPSQDPISMMALVVPMTLLYFGSIGIGALVNWRRSRREASAEAPAG